MLEKTPELAVTPATDSTFVRNCIVVPEGLVPSLEDVARAAVQHEAHEDNSDEEAGDDMYMVQFPGRKQEMLYADDIRGRLRVLLR